MDVPGKITSGFRNVPARVESQSDAVSLRKEWWPSPVATAISSGDRPYIVGPTEYNYNCATAQGTGNTVAAIFGDTAENNGVVQAELKNV